MIMGQDSMIRHWEGSWFRILQLIQHSPGLLIDIVKNNIEKD